MALGASHRLQESLAAVETMTRFALAVLALASGVYTYLGVRSILDGSPTAVFLPPSSTPPLYPSASMHSGPIWRGFIRTSPAVPAAPLCWQ